MKYSSVFLLKLQNFYKLTFITKFRYHSRNEREFNKIFARVIYYTDT